MLTFIVIGLVAFTVSAMTLFAGFGLGTLLLPAFALFLPVEVAVAATAVVHGANSVFKLALLAGHAVPRVLVRFGLPAIAAACVGAALLAMLSVQEPLLVWELGPREAVVTPIKLVMGGLILMFALLDLRSRAGTLRLSTRWLPVGGAISGFFGGLSGHQGAARAAFLLPLGLSPSQFAGTQAALAAMVDLARLTVYGAGFLAGRMAGVSGRREWTLVGVAIVCAFGGALLGRRLLPRITIGGLRLITGGLLLVVGIGLASGLL